MLRIVNSGAAAPTNLVQLYGVRGPWIASIRQARACADVGELVDEGVFHPHGPHNVSSVEIRGVEVRASDFLVLRSESVWDGLEGLEAVQVVSAWIRVQGALGPQGWRQTRDPAFVFSFAWNDEEDDFGFRWVGATIPAMVKKF